MATSKPRSMQKVTRAASNLASAEWTATHDAEKVFQQTKENSRFCDALVRGRILPCEHTAGHVEIAQALEDHRLRNENDRVNNRAKLAARTLYKFDFTGKGYGLQTSSLMRSRCGLPWRNIARRRQATSSKQTSLSPPTLDSRPRS